MDEKLNKILQDYVATANSGKYNSWDKINSKFPELKGYEAQLLQDYVATSNSGKYTSWDEINSKFPELKKQAEGSTKGLQNTSQNVKPTSSNVGLTDLSSIGSGVQQPTIPTPVANAERVKYEKQQAVNQNKAKVLSDQLVEYQVAFDSNSGVGSSERIQKAIEEQNTGGIRDSEGDAPKFLRNSKKSFSNLATALKGVMPRTDLVSTSALESALGRENAIAFTNFLNYNPITGESDLGTDFKTIQNKALEDLTYLETQTVQTEGVIDNLRDFNVVGLASAAVDALTSLAGTFIPSVLSGGTLLATEMVGGSLYDYNEAKAKSKGITINELYEKNQADFAVPAFIGSLSFAAEKIGLKGITKAINTKLAGEGYKKVALFAFEVNKEGLTEFFQVGLDGANVALGEGKSIEEASKIAVDDMFSAKGAEAWAKGVLGSGLSVGIGRAGKALLGKTEKSEVSSIEEENKALLSDIASENIPTEVKEVLVKRLAENTEKLSEIQNNKVGALVALTEEGQAKVGEIKSKIDSIEASIDAASEISKPILQQQVDNLNKELETIYNENATPQQSATTDVVEETTLNTPVEEVVQDTPIVEAVSPISEAVDKYISSIDKVKLESPEIFWSVDKPFQKEDGSVDRDELTKAAADGRLITTEAGFGVVSEDGDIKGVFKFDLESSEKTGDKVIEAAIKAGGVKLDNFALPNLMKIYTRNGFREVSRLPFNEEFAPDGWNKEKDGTPDVVAMVYDPTNSLDITKKNFTDYDAAMQYRDSYVKGDTSVQNTPVVEAVSPISETESTQQVEPPKNIVEAFKGGEKGIAAGKKKALEKFRKAGGKATSGLNVEQAAYALEYAILSIADGTIKTAKALAKALGVKQADVEAIYKDAEAKLTSYKAAQVKKTGTIKGTIKQNTSGGTVGKTTKTVRQAIKDFYLTFNKGIREGVKQGRAQGKTKLNDFKEKIAERKAISRGLRNDIKQLLINAKKAGKIGGTVSGFKSTNLAKVLAKAETPQQLLRALEYTEKYINDAEYDTKVKKGKALQTKIKSLAGRKGVPFNLKYTLKQISKLDITKLQDIDKTNVILDKVSKILVDPLLTEDLYTDADFVKQAVQIVNEYNKARSEEITNELQLSGVDSKTLETLSIKDKQQMLLEMYNETGLNEDGLETDTPPKEKATEQYRRVAKALQDLIEDYVDTEGLSDTQKRDIEDLKNLDIDKVADKDLARLVFGLTNLVNANSTVGIGDIVVVGKVIAKSENTKLIDIVKANITGIVEGRFGKYVRTASNRISLAIKNDKYVGKIHDLLGITDFKIASIDYEAAKKIILNKIKELREKNEKAFTDPIKSILLSIYGDASQYKDSMSTEEKLSEYSNRLIAAGKSLNRKKKEAASSPSYNKDNKNYIANIEEAILGKLDNQGNRVGGIAEFEYDEDGNIVGVDVKMSQAELFKALGKPHQDYYKLVVKAYADAKDEYFRVSEYYGNKELEKDIQNYIFRGYEVINETKSSLTKSDIKNSKSIKSLASGSSEGRTNWGANLPNNRVLDFDMMGRFESDISAMLYDIHTLESRTYMDKALSAGSSPIIEALGDGNKDLAATYYEIMQRALEKDALQFGGNSINLKAYQKFFKATNELGVSLGLGGIGQYAKQMSPLFDTAVRLKNSSILLRAIQIRYSAVKPKGFEEVFKYANVTRRDIVKDNLPINPDSKAFKSNNSKFSASLRAIGMKAGDILEITSSLSLSPLQKTDMGVAASSWTAFYLDHLETNGKEANFEKLDRDALEYADLMTSNVNNESDPRFKSEINQNIYFQTFMPFMNFAINNKAELIGNFSKLNKAGVDRAQINRNIIGNITGILAYNTISLGFKTSISLTGGYLVKVLINSYTDDEDEREKLAELLEKKSAEKQDSQYFNYYKFMIKDLLFANISAQTFDLATEPISNFGAKLAVKGTDWLTGDNMWDRYSSKSEFKYQPTAYELTIGATGVAAPFWDRLGDAVNYGVSEFQTDGKFIEQRKAKIVAGGTDLIVDDYYKTDAGLEEFSRPTTSKVMGKLSLLTTVASLSGASLQEVSAIKRQMNSIDKMFVEALRGRVSIKDKEKALEEYLDFSKIEVNGKVVELTKEAQDEIAKNFEKKVKEKRIAEPISRFSGMLKSEYEGYIGNLAKAEAKKEYEDKYINEVPKDSSIEKIKRIYDKGESNRSKLLKGQK